MKKILLFMFLPLLFAACGKGETGPVALFSENYISDNPEWILQDGKYSESFTVGITAKRQVELRVDWTVALDTTAVAAYGPVYHVASIAINQVKATKKTEVSNIDASPITDKEGVLRAGDEGRFEMINVAATIRSGCSTYEGTLFAIDGLGTFMKSADKVEE